MDGLIFTMPVSGDDDVHYWAVSNGSVSDRGMCAVAELRAQHPEEAADRVLVALIPPPHAVLTWHELGDLPQKQAEAAAILQIGENTPDGDNLHTAASLQEDGSVMTAHVDSAYLRAGLEIAGHHAVDPEIVLPLALLLPEKEGQLVAGEIAGNKVLRGHHIAAPDEPAFRAVFSGENEPVEIEGEEIETGLASVLAEPPINLRSGTFARKSGAGRITARQWRILGWLIGLLLLLSLLLALATYWKFASATQRENERALTAARKVVPGVNDIEQAESEISAALGQGGGGSGGFLTLSSALYAALQDAPSVQLRQMRYGNDGILVFTLGAPSSEVLNPVLIALQEEGYKITANARQEADGMTVADITMRLP